VSAHQIERVEAELEHGHEVDAILDELWSILEETAVEQDRHGKKKPRQ
jgi:hypothetical protein